MSEVSQLGYLGISVKDLDSWRGYSTSMLGLEEVERDGDGTLLLGMDGHHHRFQLREDGEDDVAYVGWQVDTAEDLAAVASRLEAVGTPVAHGSRELAERRRVADLIRFKDPDGTEVEVFVGPERSERTSSQFHADDLGLGHLVLFVNDLETTMRFYTELLGFKVSDYVDDGRTRLGFLHCNPRHHSIAFGEYNAARKRIHHFMLQTRDIDPVGRAYDDANAGAAPVLLTLGRHSNDHMVSFYMRNPSGFAVEYGWGAREIDDCNWTVETYDSGRLWGHQPAKPSRAT